MIRDKLTGMLREALLRAKQEEALALDSLPEVLLVTPPQRQFGDFSTNVAMLLARELKRPPLEVAQAIVDRLPAGAGLIDRVEVAGAGFVNLYLNPSWLDRAVLEAHRQQEEYGRSRQAAGRIQLEFVSANPTGPLNVANGRAAALGDTLANLLEWTGWQVEREYYVNDAATSTQMRKFAESLEARYRQLLGQPAELPEDGYQGEYVTELASQIVRRDGDRHLAMDHSRRLDEFHRLGMELIVEGQQRDLEDFGVHFDSWFRESALHRQGDVARAVELLTEKGFTYQQEGAVWLRSTEFGDDKDRPLIRQNGLPTYLAADVAYHLHKLQRGFDKLIDIWGPDHHGYVARTQAAIQALGYPPERLEVLIYQIVRLFSGGELVRMSKRAGELVTLRSLMEEVGRDAARFFFLTRASDSPLDFDLELAKRQSPDNPVYYVQYAHARICSILEEAERKSVSLPDPEQCQLSLLRAPDELTLMREIADFPDEVQAAAAGYQPHRLTRYAGELAAVFHQFYTNCRVLGEEPDLTAARLALVGAARTVLRNVLCLLGVSAPEKM